MSAVLNEWKTDLFTQMKEHEQVIFCNDEKTGLQAIIAIHNTTLGPAGSVKKSMKSNHGLPFEGK